MASCENMKVGEVYKCQDCSFEFEVKVACNCEDQDCTKNNENCCDFVCCGKPMLKK
ncbi:MAG: hypothetical protein P1P64_04280 [Treponemataceae bacterium]